MTDIPPGAFADCARLETEEIRRADGSKSPAFTSRAESLKVMRAEVIKLQARVAALEAQPRPFP